MSKVGFVGLGIMGRPMAGHLRAAGHEVYVHDHKPAPQTLIAQGAIPCASGKSVAEMADVVITMVPDPRRSRRRCSVRMASPRGSRQERSWST